MKAVVTQVDCSLVGVRVIYGGWVGVITLFFNFSHFPFLLCRCFSLRAECTNGCTGVPLGWSQSL